MVSRLNPYLSFDGDARQAMEFYREVFGGELTLHTFGNFGQPDAPESDKIMHGMLEAPNGFTLMGADTPPGMEYQGGGGFSVSLSGEDETELRGYWEKLSAGGTVSVPLDKQMWGDVFGMCTDRFGVPWMVNISEPQG
ncbi:VOC family protein [Streptomyces caniscabiei]|uniref:VOC family protein n=1 Tax=Streptomyces caniscabiei TaxID=2746961 RepID=A0A927QJZ5_9ACTN|nr:VOC family protein [Streptomyces caniscabiei]MBD9701276.1 VOC family protein [Streptomyces caniscabiei]MBD9724437.1 VOC family protein [Streptomyces caniscabiei]MDX3507846.1 VOC family protein [Streptomyces caniscabiei]MDX3717808.1 VOC family protein [Streptomyces caniscabiei]MDX3726545.1 VOC family protein [Streptomyces caniscabiei]